MDSCLGGLLEEGRGAGPGQLSWIWILKGGGRQGKAVTGCRRRGPGG